MGADGVFFEGFGLIAFFEDLYFNRKVFWVGAYLR